jgi:hypothetical protein
VEHAAIVQSQDLVLAPSIHAFHATTDDASRGGIIEGALEGGVRGTRADDGSSDNRRAQPLRGTFDVWQLGHAIDSR